MQKPFTWNVKVSSYDTDMNAVLSPQNMVKYLMETAIEHTEEAGYPVEKLLEMKRGWVVLNWIIKVDRYRHGQSMAVLSRQPDISKYTAREK